MGARFPVSGARGGGRWLAVLLGFFLALASTVEAIPTRGAAGYLEIGLTTEHTENTEVSWKVYGPDMSATTGRLASAVHAGAGGATVNYTGYDSNGNLLSVNEGGNGTITRAYDGLNRVTSYTEAGKTIEYRYYASGKLAKVITNLFEPFTPNRLTQLVRELIDAADIGKRGSCHLFRHTAPR